MDDEARLEDSFSGSLGSSSDICVARVVRGSGSTGEAGPDLSAPSPGVKLMSRARFSSMVKSGLLPPKPTPAHES